MFSVRSQRVVGSTPKVRIIQPIAPAFVQGTFCLISKEDQGAVDPAIGASSCSFKAAYKAQALMLELPSASQVIPDRQPIRVEAEF